MNKHQLFRLLIGTIVLMLFVGMAPCQIFAAEVQIDFDALKKNAEKGDADAQFNLGMNCPAASYGVSKD